MPSDTKYLQKIDGTWYFRISKPPKAWGLKSEFRHTLRTNDLKIAQNMRDRYLMPVIAQTMALDAVKSIGVLISNGNEEILDKVKDLKAILGTDTSVTIGSLFNKFITYKKRGGMADSSLRTYNSSKEVIFKVIGEDRNIESLNKADFTNFRDTLQKRPKNWAQMKCTPSSYPAEGPRVSGTTINNHLDRFRFVWNWGVREGLISDRMKCPAANIKVDVVTTVKPDRPISDKDADHLIKLKKPKTRLISDKSWKYIPIIGRYTGARLAEICQLTTEDIRTLHGVLCITITNYDDKRVKTKQSVRNVPVSDKLAELIKPLIKQCEQWQGKEKIDLFKKRGDYEGKIGHDFSKRWNMAAKVVGQHCHFHALRSYAITEMANAGVSEIDRKKIAGHKDKSVHAGYTKDDLRRFKKAVDAIA